MDAAFDSIAFADVAQTIHHAARTAGLEPVTYRTPPADPTLDRARRHGPHGWVISVRTAGRDRHAVVSDMLAGLRSVNPDATLDQLIAVEQAGAALLT